MLSAHSVRRLVAAAGIAGLGTALTATAAHAAPVTAAPHTAPAMAQPDSTATDTTATATAEATGSADSGAATATSAATGTATHTVVAGDTLWRIAQSEGTKGGWQALYDLNRDQLTSGPDRLDIGQVLKLAGVTTTATESPATTTSSSQTGTAKPATTTKSASSTSTGTVSTGTGSSSTTTAPASSKAAVAIAFAKAQLGKPYVYGAEGPDAYDCSGLVQAAWKAAGVSIPRVTTDQFAAGKKVSTSALQPGDLVFYYSGISHVGMYLGDGQIIHAPNSRSVVKIVPVDSMPIAGATRPA
ncbi:LysM peptidoglycan-binding domain-containing C40 family peptidase [Yinghuangia sp. ASG 101]|uniref:C40 family peptidase n=1 Tax=Yinghuangia sp. ASG 101 TaxID=2896848 RepID=UPI001E570186|nr:LysM peptidoglycan-binding domain-containing C40 family peptidase [Yinghuangia sp. ASG 101]UGQ12930.1 LysM peptidoglycan-binding domain-containing C40 family peptidase [Yinghuangia sp. ASG 101]